jgi:hypothetical protein
MLDMTQIIDTGNNICPSNPEDRKKLKAALTEITHCYQRMDDERSAVKDIVSSISENFGLQKKVITKLARTMYKRDYLSLQQENEDFEVLYENIVENGKSPRAATE